MIFFPISCTFFLNVCRVVNVRHILFVYIFFCAIFAFVEMSVCHLRMFVKHIYWQFTLTLETNLCSHLTINYIKTGVHCHPYQASVTLEAVRLEESGDNRRRVAVGSHLEADRAAVRDAEPAAGR